MRTLLLTAIIFLSFSLHSQSFEQTSGPSSQGVCEAIIAYDNYVLTSINGNLYRSSDYGASFSQVEDDDFTSSPINPRCFAHVGNTLIMGAIESARVYRSTDNGATWDIANTGMPTISGFPAAVPIMATVEDGTVFMCGTNFVRRSTDEGLTWETMDIDGLCHGIYAYGGEIWASPSGVLNRSLDNGLTWEVMPNTGMFFGNASVNAIHVGTDVFATLSLSAGNGLYRSTDNGDTYALAGNFHNGREVKEFGGDIYVTHLSGLSKSTDGGTTWETAVLYGGSGYTADIAYDGNNTLWLSASNGLISYDLSSGSHEFMQFPVTTVQSAQVSSSGLFAVSEGQLFSSFDNGDSWTDLTENFGVFNLNIEDVQADGTDIYVIGSVFGQYYYFFSSDEGDSFTEITLPAGISGIEAIYSLNPVFIADFSGLYISQDNGMNFSSVELSDLSGTPITESYPFHKLNGAGNSMFATGTQGSAYSHDLGTTWTFIPNNGDLQLCGWPDRLIRNRSQAWPPYAIEESTDGGATWTVVPGLQLQTDGPGFIWMMDGKVYCQNSQYVANDPGALLYLEEGQSEWQVALEFGTVPATIISAEMDAEGNVLIGTAGQSAWYYDAGASSLNEHSLQAIKVYPNPASERIILDLSSTPSAHEMIIIDGSCRIVGQMRANASPDMYDISDLPAQIYQIIVLDKNSRAIAQSRFIKN